MLLYYIISEINVTNVIAIAMDIWSDHHATDCNLGIVFTVLHALELRSRSLVTTFALVFASYDILGLRHCTNPLANYAQL